MTFALKNKMSKPQTAKSSRGKKLAVVPLRPGANQGPRNVVRDLSTAAGSGAPIIQPKLRISAPNDKYEQEADRVADQVMRMPEAESELSAAPRRIQRSCAACVAGGSLCRKCGGEEELQLKPLIPGITPLVQRQEAGRDEQDEELLIQAKAAGQGGSTGATVARPEAVPRGGGRPLPVGVRAFFEPRFGAEFQHCAGAPWRSSCGGRAHAQRARLHAGPRCRVRPRRIQARERCRPEPVGA